jgi:hypothetical protein
MGTEDDLPERLPDVVIETENAAHFQPYLQAGMPILVEGASLVSGPFYCVRSIEGNTVTLGDRTPEILEQRARKLAEYRENPPMLIDWDGEGEAIDAP